MNLFKVASGALIGLSVLLTGCGDKSASLPLCSESENKSARVIDKIQHRQYEISGVAPTDEKRKEVEEFWECRLSVALPVVTTEKGVSYDSLGNVYNFGYNYEFGVSEIGAPYTMITYDDGEQEKFFLHGNGQYVAIDMESNSYQNGTYVLVDGEYILTATQSDNSTLISYFPAHTMRVVTFAD